MPETPEQKERGEIDINLAKAGWIVQSQDEIDLTTGRGIAIRELQMKSGHGFADYLLYLDRKAIGAVEAKPAGTLTGVEALGNIQGGGASGTVTFIATLPASGIPAGSAITLGINGTAGIPQTGQVVQW